MQSIHIRAFPPFRGWLDGRSELVLEVDGPIVVRDLWAMLARSHPRFRELLTCTTDEELARAVVVLQAGQQLGPTDPVKCNARIELLPSIAGGEPART